MYVSKAQPEGYLRSIPYGRSTDADTLAPDGSTTYVGGVTGQPNTPRTRSTKYRAVRWQ